MTNRHLTTTMKVVNMYSIVLIFIFTSEVLSTALNFGKFKLRSIHLEKCKGPKKLDCADFEWVVENDKIIHYNLTTFENVAPLRAKIIVATNGKGLVRLQVNKVCEHLFMKPFMETIVNVTKNCVILKSRYTFSVNIEDLIQKYYGGEFFFGNVSIHAVLNNNKCNFSCTILSAEFVPKD